MKFFRDTNSKKKFYRLKDDPVVASVKNKSFRSLVRNMKTIEDNDFEVPQNLQDTLWEYQKRGFLWLKTLCHNGFGGILADDMGLGKTLQVIDEAQYIKNANTQAAKAVIRYYFSHSLQPYWIICRLDLKRKR